MTTAAPLPAMSAPVLDALVWGLVLIPLIGAAIAATLPGRDRLTLRAVGVVAATLTFLAAVVVTRQLIAGGPGVVDGAILVELPGHFQLRFTAWTAPAILTMAGVTPLTLRAGAPRIEQDMTAYVAANLALLALSALAVLLDDPIESLAIALVAAIPFHAQTALFGGATRGTVTYRAAALWLVSDGLALGLLAAPGLRGALPPAVVALGLVGPGLIRLAAGPHGLWALSVVEMAPVTGAAAVGAVAGPLGLVLLWRLLPAVPAEALATTTPLLFVLLCGAALMGAALVVAERDLRRMVAHWIGVLSSVAALGVLVARATDQVPAAPLALVGLVGFGAAVALMVIEAVERRLETRRLPGLAGLAASAPLLAILLPVSLLWLGGAPGPGTAVALWACLGLLLAADTAVVPDVDVVGWLCLVAVFVSMIGAVNVALRVAVPAWRSHIQNVRVTFQQGIRLLIPVAALAIATAAAGPLMDTMLHGGPP